MAEFPTEIRTRKDLARLKSVLKDSEPSPTLFRRLIEIAEATKEPLSGHVYKAFTELVREYPARLTPQYHAVPWSKAIFESEDFKQIYENTLRLAG